MMREEFTELTGMYVSSSMYQVIEKHYMNTNMEKRNFCSAYKENKNGLAEKIQKEADMEHHKEILKIASGAGFKKKAEDLEKMLEEEREENLRLEKLLDRYEWQPYVNPDNVSEKEYKRFEIGHIVQKNFIAEDEAIDIIANEFGFVRDRIVILNSVESMEKNVRTGAIRVNYQKNIERRPYYESADLNYIRFDVYTKSGIRQYEMLDDELRKFWS